MVSSISARSARAGAGRRRTPRSTTPRIAGASPPAISVPKRTGGGCGALGATDLSASEEGSDVGDTQSRAVPGRGERVVNGAKQYITKAGNATSGVVPISGMTGKDREISNLLIPNGIPGH